jgi:NAD(P)-dependent dehydrogenase (short-subunit alcohol dehydrogenase family)
MDANFNPLSLKGKRYLVTGAASGIGQATSIFLSKLGADLVLLDLNAAGLAETKLNCRETDLMCEFNLNNLEGIKDVLPGLGVTINGFVHSAGVSYISPLKSISESKLLDVFRINTFAAMELAKVFTNKKVSGGEPGSIVFISSVYALVGSAGNAGYATSKAALHGLTKSLAVELAPKKIRVNCVAPGFVKTNMGKKIDHLFDEDRDALIEKLHPLGLGEPGDVANTCAFLLSDLSKWITGSIISVDGGFSAQ